MTARVGYISRLRATDDSPRRYIRVSVHDDKSDLRNAATAYAEGDFSDAEGCFHPTPYESGAFAGILRLHTGLLSAQIVSHEAVHAAAAIWRQDVSRRCDIGDDCGPVEEDFAHLVSNITDALFQILDAMEA